MRTAVLALLVVAATGCRHGSAARAPSPPVRRPPVAEAPVAATTTTLAATTTTVAKDAAGCGVPLAYPDPWPERPRYAVHLAVEPAARAVTGDVAVRFVPDGDTDRLVFRLWPNGPRIAGAGGRLDVTATEVGGQPAAGRYEPGGAPAGRPGTIWTVPGTFPAGRPVDARLAFHLALPGAVNDRVAEAGGAVRLGSAVPILSWIRGEGWQTSPAVSQSAEAAATEVADWDVTVTAPAGSATLATGDEVAPGHFQARAVRDWAATVAPMRVAQASAQGGRTTVAVGVAQGAAGDPPALAARAARALDDFAAHFGPYPYDRLSIGVTTGITGGIEFPTHIMLGAGVPAVHLVHEVAHQWFYGLAGNDQYRDPWLDEGLATYAESQVDGTLADLRRLTIPAYGRGRLGESMAYWSRADGGTYYLSVYVGGVQALGAVADRLGGYPVLDCGLRRYVHDRAYRISRPSDLLAALKTESDVDPAPALAPFGVRNG